MYNKEYYLKNREKLLAAQKEWNKKNFKSKAKTEKNRLRAIKAWKTRNERV